MTLDDLTLSDIERLIAALDAAGGDAAIRAIIQRTPLTNQPHGRITIGTIRQLLVQLNGRTVLPDNLVALLAQDDGTINTPPVDPGENCTTWEEAKQIMGDRAISLEQAQQFYGFVYTPYQRGQLAIIPWSVETLRECANTHVLVPGYPLNIAEIETAQPQRTVKISAAFKNRPFIQNEFVGVRWYLLRRGVVPGSLNKIFAEQQKLLSPQEEIPLAAELIYGWSLARAYFVPMPGIGRDDSVRCASLSGFLAGRALIDDIHSVVFTLNGVSDGNDGKHALSSMRKMER